MKLALKLFLILTSTWPKHFGKPGLKIFAVNSDYCSKLDTLGNERYYSGSSYYKYTGRILAEVEKASQLYGTYKLGFAGMIYCDTFFNNDIRSWARYFNCKKYKLPAAEKIISEPCDTTLLRENN